MQEQERVPLFRDLDGALSFAYTWRARDGVKIGQLGEYTGRDGAALILSVGEKKAQAGMILTVIGSHLSLDQRAMLDATYGGERGERHTGIERLTCGLEGSARNRSLVRMVLMREFVYGERYTPSLRQIARDCGVNPSTAARAAAQIAPEIAALRKATYEKLRPAFERRGWLEREIEIVA